MELKNARLAPPAAGRATAAAEGRVRRSSVLYPLQRPELFDRLELGDAVICRAMMSEQQLFAPGDFIIKGGEANGFVYRIRTGWAMRVRHFLDGRRQILAVLLPGELCGVASIVTSRSIDSVECATAVTTHRTTDQEMRRLAEKNPDAALCLLYQLADVERRLETWLAGLGRADAEEKMALFLLDLRARLRRLGLATSSFTLPLTQQQIADHLGLTVVHVNRVLRRFRESGILTVKSRTVILHDPPRLFAIAAPLLDIVQQAEPAFMEAE